MESPVIGGLVRVILNNLMKLLLKEVVIEWNLERELKNLQSTFNGIQNVIEDAEQMQVKSKELGEWLIRLKNVVYEADDVLDEFTTKILQTMGETQMNKKGVKKVFSTSVLFSFRLKIGHKIKDIARELDAIAADRCFHLKGGEEVVKWRDVRWPSSNLLTSTVYGREDEKEKIVLSLLNNAKHFSVLPIVGMGGLGKTTLVQLAYNDERTVKHFELRIWVCVSEDLEWERLIKAMIESAGGDASTVRELASLEHRLQDILRDKRFLVVLDNIWNESLSKWNRLRSALGCGSKGSTVIVTTRTEKAARIMATLPPHHLSYLSEADCWSLFKETAFGFETEQAKEETEKLTLIGNEIVKKCGGVPLAVKTLGALLRNSRLEKDWLFVRDSEIWKFSEREEGDGIITALKLSYYHLPSYLKRCFTFCCLFPKGYEIDREDLIHLWIANSFIMPTKERELEDTGNAYFNELVWRSLFQVVQKDNDGNIMKFRMHDLIHDLARYVAGDEYAIMDTNATPTRNDGKRNDPAGGIRHISLGTRSTFLESVGGSQTLRTVRLLDYHVEGLKVFNNLSKFSGLRVLDLSNMYIQILPSSIKSMIHLRYIDLSNTDIEGIPEAACSLKNLLTLKLRDCENLCHLPNGLRDMYNLRHLDIRNTCLSKFPRKIGKLRYLQILPLYIVGKKSGRRIGELKDFDLRGELRIKDLQLVRNIADAKAANLVHKEHLHTLSLSWRPKGDRNRIQENMEEVLEGLQPHSNLRQLEINGYGGTSFPTWIQDSKYSNLVKMSLSSCKSCEGLPSLGLLPALEYLSIHRMDAVKRINTDFYGDSSTVMGFALLKELHIKDMPDLEEWLGADDKVLFPLLRKLVISNCPKLMEFPYLPSVGHLELRECTSTVLVSAMKLRSVSFLLLKHINGLDSLPEGMLRHFSLLDSLFFVNCKELKTLSRVLDDLTALKTLILLGCESLVSLPAGLGKLSCLEKLGIVRCHGLQLLPEEVTGGLTGLQRLYLHSCHNLMSLPDNLQFLVALQTIYIKRCPKLVLPAYQHTLRIEDLARVNDVLSVDEELKEMDALQEISQLTEVESNEHMSMANKEDISFFPPSMVTSYEQCSRRRNWVLSNVWFCNLFLTHRWACFF